MKTILTFSRFKFAKDVWSSKEEYDFFTGKRIHDKFGHFLRDFWLNGLFFLMTGNLLISFIASVLFNLLWEIKDGFLDYRNAPPKINYVIRYLYGDGFSFKDLICGVIGSLLSAFLIWIFASMSLIFRNIFLLFLLNSLIGLAIRHIYLKYFNQ